jgi:serine/threonine-protein kinase
MATDPIEARLGDLLLTWEELREQGHDPTPEEVCAECPELAGELRRRIEALRSVGRRFDSQATRTLESAPADGAAGGRRSATCVAHFDGLEFHASGGLGEVFRARSDDLNREVALKFLKRRRADDPESRRRFFLEAEVTGRLEHPGVVPVYGVGADDQGHPCYAMRFILGETLGEAIDRHHAGGPAGRALEFRTLLRRFASVCNTVAYAHSRGVLHRDIKPRNVMLGPFDETLVVDWGLTRAVEGLDPDSDPLRPGASSGGPGPATAGVLGTPGYMSPEQAEGGGVAVGPASDVYGLGATLYCLLTGRAPFQGARVEEVLERVRRGDFPPPRAVRSAVPKALEAVCLKAMSMKPGDRYGSALELAADLDRWLADEPVSAWREPLATRLARWGRRHKTLVTTAAALLITAVVALAIGTALIMREQRKTAGERDRGDANLKKAREAVYLYLVKVSENRLLNEPGFKPLRRELMESAREYYQQIADERAEDPAALADLGMAYGGLAQITADVEGPAKAVELNGKAQDILRRLAAAHPGEPRHGEVLAKSDFVQGVIEQKLGRPAEAEAAYKRALAAREALARQRPADADLAADLAATHNALGVLYYAAGRMRDAGDAFGLSLAAFEGPARAHPGVARYRHGVASQQFNLALVLRETGRSHEAKEAFEAVLKLREAIARDFPKELEVRRNLVFSHAELALLLFRDLHEPKDAEAAYLRALELARKLARDNPVPLYQGDVAKILNNLGILYQQTDRVDEAVKTHEEALTIRRALALALPDDPGLRNEVAASLGNLAFLYRDRGDDARADAAEAETVATFERLAREHPEVLDYAMHLGTTHQIVGLSRARRADWAGAAAAFDEAIRTTEGLLARVPNHPYVRGTAASSLWRRGDARSRLGRHDEALDDLDRAGRFDSGSLREPIKLCRALVLARRGDVAKAVAEAEAVDPKRLSENGVPLRGGYEYDMATVFALCTRAAADRADLAGQYAARAVGLLRQADVAGFFPDLKAVERLLKTPEDLAALRPRDDFKAFVAGVEGRRRK